MHDAVKRFRRVAFAEGVSYLLLLFIAMPLKYAFAIPLAVKVVGWIHGALFIAYLIFAMRAALSQKWNFRFCVFVFLASIIPFGTFWLDRKLETS
jgi:integral membrane protein